MNKLLPPGTIYQVSEPEYVGSVSIKQEIEEFPLYPPVQGWTVGEFVSIDGNKYLRLLSAYLKKVGKESEDDLSKDEIEQLYSKCEI